MSWKPLLYFDFDNHAALDETGHGFHGRVELPGADRWVDRPFAGISTAVCYDHPESKIVVAQRPAFAGWRGLRVRAYFKADNVGPRRLNLVEGDGSFALFTDTGGVLRGTVNDGSPQWWGISSVPGRLESGKWYLAELLYDSGQVLTLSVDGQLLGARMTAGLPIQPVGERGIRIGYWPGGDSRYTFQGLMGPVWVDTLDEREEIVCVLARLLCDGSDGTSRLESWNAALEGELSAAEKQAVRDFGAAAVAGAKRLGAVVVGQSAEPAATLDSLMPIADEISRLALERETGGADLLKDPQLACLISQFLARACAGGPAAAGLFPWEALRLLSADPLSSERWAQIRRAHPDWCTDGIPPVFPPGGGPGGPGSPGSPDWLEGWLRRWCAQHGQGPGSPGGPADPCGPGDPCGCSSCRTYHPHARCTCERPCTPRPDGQ
ncbi:MULTISPECIES: hypothetical protein [Streptomyces]|uniref:hypothetical protein n=1 Tax=Streptomyces TaxID=1883 RepID=UPI000B9E50F4|nr:hypothetical protein [Streptomyces kasugaensis]